jgi:putative spermidine/putrescine transport system permease protein
VNAAAPGRAAPYWLASPATLVMLALVALPLILTLSLSFYTFDPASGIKETLTLANYRAVLTDDYYYGIFLRTFWLALLVTLLSVLIGVPEAYVLLRMSERWRAVFMVVVLGPLLVSVVVRTLGWAVLLGSEGIINGALRALGLIDEPIRMMFTFGGVLVALTHVLAPFMVLAVWTSLQKLDPATEQAAESLGASTATVMFRIVFPQVMPGILSGSMIVFALAASAFATPAIIGGRRLKVVPTAAYDEFLSALNWPLGAAIAVLLLIAVLVITIGVNRAVERRFRQVFA